MSTVSFEVPGIAAPQGSKTKTRWGMREDNPNTKPWRATVAAYADEAMVGRELLAGPLELTVIFAFPRPKGHYGTGSKADTLKATAPLWHTSKPDSDKLVRAVGDSLTGRVCRDDSQIASLRIRKVYGVPKAIITISELIPPSLEATR